MKKKVLSLVLTIVLAASANLFSACQFFYDSSLENSTSSSSSSVEESSNSSIEESSSSLPEIIEPCEEHTFGEWETVQEYFCGTRKQRICSICETIEMNTITTEEQFLTHTFDDNTLCTTCGHQEFIESEEYFEETTIYMISMGGSVFADPGTLWWNKDRTYGLKIYQHDYYPYAFFKGYVGTPIHVQLPSYFNGVPFGEIDQPKAWSEEGAFKNCTTIKSIYIPDTVTRIAEYSFDGCTNLESIRLSENLQYLGGSTFRNCTSLISIHLPLSLATSIYELTFNNCISLKIIYIPKSRQPYIYEDAFNGCSSDLEIIYYE